MFKIKQLFINSVKIRLSINKGTLRITKSKVFVIAFLFLATCCLSIVVEVILLSTFKASLRFEKDDQGIDQSFTIKLGKKIKGFDAASINIKPQIKGTWNLQHGNLIESDKLVFRPDTNFSPNQIYKIEGIRLNNWLLGVDKLDELTFNTEPIIGIKKYGLISLEDKQLIPADYTFIIKVRNNTEIDLKIDSNVELIKSKEKDLLYWKPNGLLEQGKEIKLNLIKGNELLYSKILSVAPEPDFKINKTSLLKKGDLIELDFNEDIDRSTDNKIAYEFDNENNWISDRKIAIKLRNVDPGVTYSYQIKSGLRTKRGGILTKDYKGYISTIGAVTVLSSSPNGTDLNQNYQLVSVTFDQAVNKNSVEQRFKISSGKIESTYWEDNTFYAKVYSLGYQKNIEVKLAAGVESLDFGLPSTKEYSYNFTTEAKSTRFNVPFYRQQYRASCSAASLRMILSYKGIDVKDMEIIYRMGYNPRQIDRSGNFPKWDDPDEMFVGDVNGKITEGTAAGPDALPIVKAAKSFGRDSSRSLNINTNWISDQISKGKLVIAFGAFGGSNSFIQWITPNGRIETMNVKSHIVTVIGYKGEFNEPLGFWVNDPLSSNTEFWSNSQMQNFINLDPYKQAIAVN